MDHSLFLQQTGITTAGISLASQLKSTHSIELGIVVRPSNNSTNTNNGSSTVNLYRQVIIYIAQIVVVYCNNTSLIPLLSGVGHQLNLHRQVGYTTFSWQVTSITLKCQHMAPTAHDKCTRTPKFHITSANSSKKP